MVNEIHEYYARYNDRIYIRKVYKGSPKRQFKISLRKYKRRNNKMFVIF